jgi:hypothetical protein
VSCSAELQGRMVLDVSCARDGCACVDVGVGVYGGGGGGGGGGLCVLEGRGYVGAKYWLHKHL